MFDLELFRVRAGGVGIGGEKSETAPSGVCKRAKNTLI